MQTRTYTERSNARRAARAAGLDPETAVIPTDDGFEVRFPDADQRAAAKPTFNEKQRVLDAAEPEHGGTVVRTGPDQSEVRFDDGKTRVVTNSAIKPAEVNDGLDIPDFCKVSPEQRKAAWVRNPPRAAAAPAKPKEITMPKTKAKNKKPRGANGGDKNATLLKMLGGTGSTVDAMCKELGWLPHTLRARLSRLNKPKSKGGEGMKIERSREDKTTTYRLAS